jgi:hypothetical protein
VDFKEAYEQIEKSLFDKIAKTALDGDGQRKAAEVTTEAFMSLQRLVPEMDIPEAVLFVAKVLAFGGLDFLQPGRSPAEINTALTEISAVFQAAFVTTGVTIYGAREQYLIQQAQAVKQAPSQAQKAPAMPHGSIIDLSKLKGKI